MPKSIAIITNEFCDKFEGSKYFIELFMGIWRKQGIQVHVTGGANYIPADIAILHVDTTVVGEQYTELAARYPVAINGLVKDISKTFISKHLLKQGDPWSGRVIVKTDANYGGVIEYQHKLKAQNLTFRAEEIERPWRKREYLDSFNYPVFDNIKDVPHGVWGNKYLVVEKLLTERLDNGEYMHRCYFFFGTVEHITWFAAPQPVIKGSNSTSRGVSNQIPEIMQETREAFGFGYGRFDYTIVDGETIIFDVNRTPAYGSLTISLYPDEMIEALANAIFEFE